jgi:hypothetical protein
MKSHARHEIPHFILTVLRVPGGVDFSRAMTLPFRSLSQFVFRRGSDQSGSILSTLYAHVDGVPALQ